MFEATLTLEFRSQEKPVLASTEFEYAGHRTQNRRIRPYLSVRRMILLLLRSVAFSDDPEQAWRSTPKEFGARFGEALRKARTGPKPLVMKWCTEFFGDLPLFDIFKLRRTQERTIVVLDDRVLPPSRIRVFLDGEEITSQHEILELANHFAASLPEWKTHREATSKIAVQDPLVAAGDTLLELELAVPDGVSDRDIVQIIRELSLRADDLHRALGGAGIVINAVEISSGSLVVEGQPDG